MYKTLLVRGQWVTGENQYGYPAGERLPLHTPFQKFNWLKVNGLLSNEPPLEADSAIEKDSSSEGSENETAPISLEDLVSEDVAEQIEEVEEVEEAEEPEQVEQVEEAEEVVEAIEELIAVEEPQEIEEVVEVEEVEQVEEVVDEEATEKPQTPQTPKKGKRK